MRTNLFGLKDSTPKKVTKRPTPGPLDLDFTQPLDIQTDPLGIFDQAHAHIFPDSYDLKTKRLLTPDGKTTGSTLYEGDRRGDSVLDPSDSPRLREPKRQKRRRRRRRKKRGKR